MASRIQSPPMTFEMDRQKTTQTRPADEDQSLDVADAVTLSSGQDTSRILEKQSWSKLFFGQGLTKPFGVAQSNLGDS